jgi:hypothetical protein
MTRTPDATVNGTEAKSNPNYRLSCVYRIVPNIEILNEFFGARQRLSQ